LATYGANEAGFCTAGAALNAGADADRLGVESVAAWRARGGLIAPGGTWLLLLECGTVNQARTLIENPDVPFANVGNIMLFDASGHDLVWQCEGLMRIFREPKGDWLIHTCTNYPTGEWPQDTTEAGTARRLNGQMREANLARMVAEIGQRDLGLRRIVRMLRSHAEPGPLCQHPGNNLADYQTVLSYVIDPTNGDIYAAYHNPCRHKYLRYSLR